ncbi:MAG: hypothetical protein MK212_12195 [Saprospiraceae bacterium]|nr:hypothetical protein [Saprospiraceae bacterium]
MRLPIIKHFVQFIDENDEDFLLETIATLEDLTLCDALKDQEIDVIGELLSNLYGALEVANDIKEGTSKRDALNGFMQRVIKSIDR